MNRKHIRRSISIAFLAWVSMGIMFLVPCTGQGAVDPLLKEIIIAYNQRVYGESLQDGSYRGEEGLLKIGPETARSLGLNSLIDRDYLEAKEQFQKSEKLLEKAKAGMTSQRREKTPNEHARQVADSFLSYRRCVETGRQKMMEYRSRLTPQVDDRLNDAVTSLLLEKLVAESLNRYGHRLRDALAHFFNECRGIPASDHPLSPENVGFVNEVFRQYQFRASKEALSAYDMDRDPGGAKKASAAWKRVLEKNDLTYFDTVCNVLDRILPKIYPVDPLLFLALMKRESGFDPFAVSRSGAAGLTQIMPQTALELGMKNIYKPGYFEQAFSIQDQERKKRNEAMAALARITPEDALSGAVQARGLMQESIAYTQEKERFFARYKNDLLHKREDDRFKPAQAIEHGLRYFSRLLQEQEGDVSLALAAYNAGPHRVREYRGIPPFSETVHFRNKVSDYYREYLKRVERLASKES
jgi:soluble lytic murein transglycosylase-like protein